MRTTIILTVMALLGSACSGSGGSTSTSGSSGSSGGSSGTSGTTSSCTASAPTVLVPDFGRSISVHAAGNDLYWIDLREGFDHGSGVFSGVIKHMKTDGTGLTTLVTPSFGSLLAIGVTDTDLYYLSENADSSHVFLYKTSRTAGGEGTQVGTGEFSGARSVEGDIYSCASCGVFGSSGSKVFVNDSQQISSVDTTSGATTILATAQVLSTYPALVGNTVFYKDLTSPGPFVWSVPADGSTAAVEVGSQTCGVSTRESTMGAFSGGFICGGLLTVTKLDTGAIEAATVFDGSSSGIVYEPSPADANGYYLTPTDPSHDNPIYRADPSNNALTQAVCAARSVGETALTATDFVWVEVATDSSGNASYSLRRIAR